MQLRQPLVLSIALLAFVTALLFGGLTATGAHAAQNAAGTLVYQFDLSTHDSGEEANLWIPYPLSSDRQLIIDVKIEGDFQEASVVSDREFSTPMLYARWPKGATSRKLTFSFKAEREAVRQSELPTAVVEPTGDMARWLKATSLGPIDGVVKKLADEITAGKKGVLEKARAIYLWTCANTYRDPETNGCGVGDVSMLLRKPGGKCADIHSVFVALARAAGVPARELFGIRLGKKDGQDVTTWEHCWAEFYLPGYGWVVVDPGDVRKMMLKRGLTPMDEVPQDLIDFYWGGADPYRVQLSIGRDLTLNPPQQGAPVNYLMYPFAQVGGKTLDWLNPAEFKYTITYRAN